MPGFDGERTDYTSPSLRLTNGLPGFTPPAWWPGPSSQGPKLTFEAFADYHGAMAAYLSDEHAAVVAAEPGVRRWVPAFRDVAHLAFEFRPFALLDLQVFNVDTQTPVIATYPHQEWFAPLDGRTRQGVQATYRPAGQIVEAYDGTDKTYDERIVIGACYQATEAQHLACWRDQHAAFATMYDYWAAQPGNRRPVGINGHFNLFDLTDALRAPSYSGIYAP